MQTNQPITATLAQQLAELLREDPQEALLREQTAFDALVACCDQRIVLFGTGSYGRTALACLRSAGIEPLAFSDNDRSRWYTEIDGLLVLPPQQAAERYGQDAAFVVTIWNNAHSFRHTRDQLCHLQCTTILPAAALRWKFPAAFPPYFCLDLPHSYLRHADALSETFSTFSDHFSRCEFLAQLRWRLLGDHAGLADPVVDEQYFPTDLYALRAEEVFVDCGAFDGDTMRGILARQGESFRQIIALEPDPSSFQALHRYIGQLSPQVQRKLLLLNTAVGADKGRLRFTATGGLGSSISQQGNIIVDCEKLDDLLADAAPTYIKMDIEGAELDALDGARRTITRAMPILAICLYHRPHDFWQIPLAIHHISHEYALFLRPHKYEGWESVCYAIPPDRMRDIPGA